MVRSSEVSGGREELLYQALGKREMIYGLALRIVKNKHDAEDVMQETLIRIWGNIKSYDPAKGLSTWVGAITKNVAKSYLRRRRCDPFDDSKGREYQDTEDYSAGLIDKNGRTERTQCDSLVVGKRAIQLVRDSLETLGNKQREAVVLGYFTGLRNDKAAKYLGISKSAFSSRLSKARSNLAKLILEHTEEAA